MPWDSLLSNLVPRCLPCDCNSVRGTGGEDEDDATVPNVVNAADLPREDQKLYSSDKSNRSMRDAPRDFLSNKSVRSNRSRDSNGSGRSSRAKGLPRVETGHSGSDGDASCEFVSESAQEEDALEESETSAINSSRALIALKAPESSPKRKDKPQELLKQALGAASLQELLKPAADGPTAVEISRGVHIDRWYDFYDPSRKHVVPRRMDAKEIHTRASARQDPEPAINPEMFESSSSSISSASSPESVCEESGSEAANTPRSNASGVDEKKKEAGHTKAPRSIKMKMECITMWAVIVGLLLHRQVLDFPALIGTSLRERRHQAAAAALQASKGTVRSSLHQKAGIVVSQAIKLASKLKKTTDLFDAEWKDSNLLSHLFSTQYVDLLLLFARGSAKLLAKQPMVAAAVAPCRVFGDIHGQLRDLLLILAAFGAPSEKDATSYVFNGDFVDRGSHQVEVIGLLLALKIWMPDRIWLVRGNHEDRIMNDRYGFKDACTKSVGSTFGPKLFDRIQQVFDVLPLACLIEKKVLCVHGGIGDGMWNLEHLKSVKRPLNSDMLQDPCNRWVNEILWSDPIEDGKDSDQEIFGVHESPRGAMTCEFAWNITKMFCARNGLSLVVRSHQSKIGSLGFEFMHENLLSRVFSARDYEDHGNDGAVLMITKSIHGKTGSEILKVRCQVLRSLTKTNAAPRTKSKPRRKSLTKEDIRPPELTKKRISIRRLSTSELMGSLA